MEAEKITLKTLTAAIAGILISEVLIRPAVNAVFIAPMPGLGITRMVEIVLLIFITVRFEKRTDNLGLVPAKIPAGIRKGLIWSARFGPGKNSGGHQERSYLVCLFWNRRNCPDGLAASGRH
jgi:hypothetical protein